KQLVQNHRIHGDELLALKAIYEKNGRTGVVEFSKVFLDNVQTFHRAAVIVVVVADDQSLGHPLDPSGVTGKGFHAVRHRTHSPYGSTSIAIWSKRVTLSAFVQRAILPAPVKVLSIVVNSVLSSNSIVNRSPCALRPSECHSLGVTLMFIPSICSRRPLSTR